MLIMTKQEAIAEIAEKVKIMKQALTDAQTLADEHGLSFKAGLTLPPGHKQEKEYGVIEVTAEYYGKGNTQYSGPEYPLEEGTWAWEQSSLSC
jgi:hypothetical protein